MGLLNDVTCCCGPCSMHVKTGARVIAFLGFFLNIGNAAFALSGQHELLLTSTTAIYVAAFHIFMAFLFLSIIYAQKKQKHELFWPFLIAMGISLCFQFCTCLVTAGLVVVAPQWMVEELKKADGKRYISSDVLRLGMAFTFGVLAVALAVSAWLYSVVYRAYKHVKRDNREVLATTQPKMAQQNA